MSPADPLVDTPPHTRWDLATLFTPPATRDLGTEIGVRSLLYEGIPYQGRTTSVFAYLGVPENAPGEDSVPGMVLVHGGGGTAFRDWVTLWNARGYAAIAMDLGGCGPGRQRLPDGGPGQDDPLGKFRDPLEAPDAWADHWVQHAAAAVVRAHSLLAAQPGVDPTRVGLTGISWGGFLTCLVAGLDRRFRFAAPVYGCGNLHVGSSWLPILEKMTPEGRENWRRLCDPAVYLPHASMPMLFVNGTNDAHYWLPPYRASYSLVRSGVTLSVRAGMTHSHPAGWRPREVERFAEYHARGTAPLPRVDVPDMARRELRARVSAQTPVAAGTLAYTTDAGRWPDRPWLTAPARVERDAVIAGLPSNATAAFLAVADEAGMYASSPHLDLLEDRPA